MKQMKADHIKAQTAAPWNPSRAEIEIVADMGLARMSNEAIARGAGRGRWRILGMD
jgi:hypothetical protein